MASVQLLHHARAVGPFGSDTAFWKNVMLRDTRYRFCKSAPFGMELVSRRDSAQPCDLQVGTPSLRRSHRAKTG
jgi:hypothetical protein